MLQEPAVETSSCACASATPWRVCVCVRLCIGHSVQAFQVTPFRVLGIGSLEAWAFLCGHPGLRRPLGQSSRPRCAGVCRTPAPFPFGAVVLTRQAFSGCSHGMVGTEVEKGDPRPRLPLPPGCCRGRRKPGNFLRVSGSSLPLSLASYGRGLLTAQPAQSSRSSPPSRAASLPLRCQELRHPRQWQRPKPQF